MKITKKAKSVELVFKERQYTDKVLMYTCPTCKTTFQMHGVMTGVKVTRFICSCGQELAVSGEK